MAQIGLLEVLTPIKAIALHDVFDQTIEALIHTVCVWPR